MPFNQLSDAQAERLALLSEELGEAQQAVGKILRHGYGSRHPGGGPTNRESLQKELGDVKAAINLLTRADDLSSSQVSAAMSLKLDRVGQYMHHQEGRAEKYTCLWGAINEALDPEQRKEFMDLVAELKIISAELYGLRWCYESNSRESKLIDRLRAITQQLPHLMG